MKLFGSLRWDGAPDFFIGLGFGVWGLGGGVVEKHCTRASLHSDSGRSDQNQCRGVKSGRF